MTRHPQRHLAGEEGSVLITGLLLSIALLMVIGFAVDLGHAFLVKRQLASIADDAALSGSQAIDLPALHAGHLQLNPGQARLEALRTIDANPSVTGQANATAGTVTVTVTRRVPTILLALVGLKTLTLTAHATAAPRGP
ncbi:MAG TPA: pilus assembly protein TadG-related protein [Solirubrobacteraceae bacterium]|jgi:Flp pilus assembly protein TadG|nr:pilus assembly protein TadG-related protein [Solirubrobacteraceae bacterium]